MGREPGGDYISQAVRKPGAYVTKRDWEDGDFSLANMCQKSLWLSSIYVTVNPQTVVAGALVVRLWDTYRRPNATATDPEPVDDFLIVEYPLSPTYRFFYWEPPILLTEESAMRYPDGRIVKTTYNLRYFFQFGFRVQVCDVVAGTYTTLLEAMHVSINWLV